MFKPLHIHILGICGTFMGGIAAIAQHMGHRVTGSDTSVYPPMSTQLAGLGIGLMEGYRAEHLQPAPDLVIVGNVLSRGNEAVEYLLDANIPYISGPQWLYEHVLKDCWVLAVAGTHGKTTTASMAAWILQYAGMEPGFLIGGVPQLFSVSARLPGKNSDFFVIEADEYDSAFFDKRSKFVHYHPRTLVINNIEFDHADIFDSITDIEKQFNHLVRIVPKGGLIVAPTGSPAVERTFARGLWTPVERIDDQWLDDRGSKSAEQTNGSPTGWQAKLLAKDGSEFEVWLAGEMVGVVKWPLMGDHSVHNGLMAIAAARHTGVPVKHCIAALCQFKSPKRRMEFKGEFNGTRLYDDFAHHPSAVATTLAGLRASVGSKPILAILEPRSSTMKTGIHNIELAASVSAADLCLFYQPQGLSWSFSEVTDRCTIPTEVFADIDKIVAAVVEVVTPEHHIVVMSNGGFGQIVDKLQVALSAKFGDQQ